MNEFGYLNLLKPQLFTLEEEVETIKNTMTLDFAFGNIDVVKTFAEKYASCKPWSKKHFDYLTSLDEYTLRLEVDKAKSKSLLMTAIMLTGECNANCQVCYTNRKKKENELDWPEIKEIIDQTQKLGSRTIYIAGEGEPLLDKSIFKIFDYSKKIKMDVLMFTNGLLFSNDEICKSRLGIEPEELIKKISTYPVYIYHKFWSTIPEKNAILMGLHSRNNYQYTPFDLEKDKKIQIPKGLELLLKYLPIERIGIECYVEQRTADEIKEKIIPFIEKTGVKSYIEPLIHSGKNFGTHIYDPTPEQIKSLQHLLVRQGCTRVAYLFAVHNNGYATPGISILPEHLVFAERYNDLNVRLPDGRIKDLLTLRHTHPFLVKNRYRISGCLCEEFNLEIAKKIRGGYND